MPILLSDGKMYFCQLALISAEFPSLFGKFIEHNKETRSIEYLGDRLRASGYDANLAKEFVKAVCAWGGYSGVWGRVLQNNSIDTICTLLESATFETKRGDACAGLDQLCKIKGLAVSFASKHLKFLCPEEGVVLDSVISSGLGYPLSTHGYRRFLDDCHRVLTSVRQADIPYPGWGKNGWRVSDIEMVIFTKLRSESSKSMLS